MERLKIGGFAPRGQGKTVTVGAWHAKRTGDGLKLKTSDEPTVTYLRPIAEKLDKGMFPDFTMLGKMDVLKWEATLNGRSCLFDYIDFAGELTDILGKVETRKFRNDVSNWMATCDALLIFIDSTLHDDVQYLDALDKLFAEIKNNRTKHGSKRRVVAVVITKADELPGATPTNIQNPNNIASLVSHNRIFQRVKEALADLKDHVQSKEFLTSAVGWEFKNKKKFEPCNLFAPLKWVLEQGQDVVKVDRTRRYITAGYTMAVSASLMGASWYLGAQINTRVYTAYEQFVQSNKEEEQAPERLAFFNEKIKPRQWDWLWGLNGRRKAAQELAERDQRIAGRLAAENAFKLLASKDNELQKKGRNPSRYHAAEQFLENHETFAPDPILRQIAKIKEVTKLDYENDLSKWSKVRDLAINSPTDYDAKAAKLREYASRQDAHYVDQATKMTEQTVTMKNADKAEYDVIWMRSQQVSISSEIEELRKLVESYLVSQNHSRTMKINIDAWKKELNSFKKIRIHVGKVSLPTSFVTGHTTGWPKTQVTIKIDNESDVNSYAPEAKPKYEGGPYEVDLDKDYGPFIVGYGRKQSLYVEVRVRRTWFTEENKSITLSHDQYILDRVQGKVLLPIGWTGGNIEVHMSCSGAKINPLNPWSE